jgi:hypothetical protein
MKDDNLLVVLSKYKPREKHTPLENFITESFAWLLRNNREFATEFFHQMCNQQDPGKIKSIDTQTCLSGTYPDMVIQTQSNVFLFEHKTYSPLSPNQLDKYREFGNKKYGEVSIVLITGSKSQHEQRPDIALTWLDVYQFIKNVSSNLPTAIFLDEFADLLKENGLGPQPALSFESIISYLPSKNFRPDLEQILWKVYETIRNTNKIDSFYKNIAEIKEGNIKWNGDIAKFWGRVGTEFLKVWRPGVFVGCMVDNTDHANTYMDYSKGIDYCLILSFDQEISEDDNMKCYGFIYYEHDQSYSDLVVELQSSVTDLDGYEFYNHLIEKDPNRWHPIYVRKSLSEVLVGCETQEDQVTRLVNDSDRLVGLLANSDSFKGLRRKYQVGN